MLILFLLIISTSAIDNNNDYSHCYNYCDKYKGITIPIFQNPGIIIDYELAYNLCLEICIPPRFR